MEALRELTGFFPEAAKDIKLNLQSVLAESSLSEGQRWLVDPSCAASLRHSHTEPPSLMLLDASRNRRARTGAGGRRIMAGRR